MSVNSPQYVVITRPLEDEHFSQAVKNLGKRVFVFPTISFRKYELSLDQVNYLRDLSKVDWVLFTSQNGIKYLVEIMNDLKTDPEILQTKKIGVVGDKTAEAVEKFGFSVEFTPTNFTAENLAYELPEVEGKTILLTRAKAANLKLKSILKKRGAKVIDIPVYKTELISEANPEFINLLKQNRIACLILTSPSTVKGFFQSLSPEFKLPVLSIPTLAIGSQTTKFLKQSGFKTVYTADTFTADGIIAKLKQIL